jgi:hypothetical protein
MPACDDPPVMRAAVGLLCKAPRPGLSKTRLMPAVGAAGSARLSRAFLQDVGQAVRSATTQAGASAVAVYAPADADAEIRDLLPGFDAAFAQMGGTLGDMMMQALAALLSSNEIAVLIGSDVPTVPLSVSRMSMQ